jgi:hypothetical protein
VLVEGKLLAAVGAPAVKSSGLGVWQLLDTNSYVICLVVSTSSRKLFKFSFIG